MLTAELLVINKKSKPPKYPSIDQRINKMWYSHITTLFSHKNKLPIHPIALISLENILLIERSQRQRPHSA